MTNTEKVKAYKRAVSELTALLSTEKDVVLKMSTINCVLKHKLPYYFWVGFYTVKDRILSVGPYQGTLGCLHIPFGQGVCGTAAAKKKTQLVPDVHKFPGHIACDSRSKSEIVVPVFGRNNKLIAVFDVDSEIKGAFNKIDQEYLEQILKQFFS